MEPIFLTCMVLAFFLTKSKVDTAAYANGKESPGVAKARLRHENHGGGRSASGRPKGSGAFRLLLASRWDNACKSAAQRADHRAARRRDWFDRTKNSRDERWRGKMQRRLDRADERRDRWAGLLTGLRPDEFRRRRTEDAAWRENAQRDDEAARRETTNGETTNGETKPTDPETASNPATNRTARTRPDRPGTKPRQRLKSALVLPRKAAVIATKPAGTSPNPVGNAPAAEGNTNVYLIAVTRLTAEADRIAAWRTNLKSLSDGLAAKGWGSAVTGPTADMDSELASIEGDYRTLAAQMKQQGDNGKAAYEQAPWVPSAEAVLA